MIDAHAREQRSRTMAAIRGKGNKSTEIKVLKYFRTHKIRGWRRHIRNLPGSPDFVFPKQKIAIFANGCYWHRCPYCGSKTPKTHKAYWINKFKENMSRDRRKVRQLKRMGWGVYVFWECKLKKNIDRCMKKLKNEI